MRHWICHRRRNVHRGTRNNGPSNRGTNTIGHVWWGSNWGANSRNEGSSNGLAYSSRPVHANSWNTRWGLGRLLDRIHGSSCGPIWLTGNGWLGHRFVSICHTRDIMYAWSPPVFVHRVQANEVFLRMTSNLSRSPWNHKVSGYAPPVTLPIFL